MEWSLFSSFVAVRISCFLQVILQKSNTQNIHRLFPFFPVRHEFKVQWCLMGNVIS